MCFVCAFLFLKDVKISVIATLPCCLRRNRRKRAGQNSQGIWRTWWRSHCWGGFLVMGLLTYTGDKSAQSGEAVNIERGKPAAPCLHGEHRQRAPPHQMLSGGAVTPEAPPHVLSGSLNLDSATCSPSGNPTQTLANCCFHILCILVSGWLPLRKSVLYTGANAFQKNVVHGAVNSQWTVNTVLAKTPSFVFN